MKIDIQDIGVFLRMVLNLGASGRKDSAQLPEMSGLVRNFSQKAGIPPWNRASLCKLEWNRMKQPTLGGHQENCLSWEEVHKNLEYSLNGPQAGL